MEEIKELVKQEPDNNNYKCRLASAYNDYIVDSWEKSPYPYGKIGKVLTSKEAAEKALLYFQRAKVLGVENDEINQTLDKNMAYANWASEKHIDWGFDRTLNLTDVFMAAIIPVIVLLIMGALVLSGDLTKMAIGVGLLALYIWKKFIPGWKIHDKQLYWEKMLARSL